MRVMDEGIVRPSITVAEQGRRRRIVRSRFMMDTVAPVGERQFRDWFR
jgi:hypothetical protein